jgi:3-oxoacyl-[acyl-carrier protein] reductase
MNLKLKDSLFVVTGATSGLGRGVARALLKEEARIIAVARDENNLKQLTQEFPDSAEIIAGDVLNSETFGRIIEKIGNRWLSGVLVNAGGPPAKSFLETKMNDWDSAYSSLLRWKVEFTKAVLPIFLAQSYGRFLFIESSSVKQPVENLVLSNSLRLSVVGFVKTLSREVGKNGITMNILAPGFHETPAAQRVFDKISQTEKISLEEAILKSKSGIPVGFFGDPDDFGALAAWLLSPLSAYITGQTISVDGGSVKWVMG